ncbi:MAG: hypothetical protein JST36_00920 [Bacteroidetes bacterium]|nr:hypothetical protein [Bacteroidota bacterium]
MTEKEAQSDWIASSCLLAMTERRLVFTGNNSRLGSSWRGTKPSSSEFIMDSFGQSSRNDGKGMNVEDDYGRREVPPVPSNSNFVLIKQHYGCFSLAARQNGVRTLLAARSAASSSNITLLFPQAKLIADFTKHIPMSWQPSKKYTNSPLPISFSGEHPLLDTIG